MKGTLILEEASVIALVRSGDIDAFAEIVEYYQAPVRRYLYRLTGDSVLAEDLAQDTFIQAYKGILKTDSELSFKAWLYRIATNNAYQHLRRKRLISFLPFSGLKKETQSLAGDCSAETDENLAVQDALSKIPEDQKTCLILHLVEGFKYREIGEILKISEDAVRMRVARGKESFQKSYQGGEDQ
jgi:RNA polymerase sigma-70 factor (ECF subfamily)